MDERFNLYILAASFYSNIFYYTIPNVAISMVISNNLALYCLNGKKAFQ